MERREQQGKWMGKQVVTVKKDSREVSICNSSNIMPDSGH